MKVTGRHLLALSLAALCAAPAEARNDRSLLSIDEALATPDARAKLGRDVKLFFADTPPPKVLKTIGTWKTSKKTNASNKADKEACQWAFLSAVLQLQKRAREEGGDAVIAIYSNYDNIPTSNPTHFVCGAGNIMAGVALKGTVVRLAE